MEEPVGALIGEVAGLRTPSGEGQGQVQERREWRREKKQRESEGDRKRGGGWGGGQLVTKRDQGVGEKLAEYIRSLSISKIMFLCLWL